MKEYQVKLGNLQVEHYQELRSTTKWHVLEDSVVRKALDNDLFSIGVFDNGKVMGMGRVIGDGAIYFYIQDVIVHPDYQGHGIGNLIMQHIETYLQEQNNAYAFVGLMAANGVKEFYSKHGYKERPNEGPGMYKIFE